MKYCSFFLLCLLFFSCKKESIDLDTQVIVIPTTNDIYDIVFLDENIAYACGGNLWEDGFIAKSEDGGNTWVIVYDHFNIIYKLDFKNQQEGIAGGFWGGILKTFDGGNSWTFLEYLDTGDANNDVQFVSDSIVLIGTGNSYHFGGVLRYNFYTDEYSFQDKTQTIESIYLFDDNLGVLGAYGVIYTTEDGGQSIQATNASGDFFKDVEFSGSSGIAVGYQGKIFTSNNQGSTWEKSSRKASFFTTKGNLESVAVNGNQAFICGQNGAFFYANNFLDSWAEVNHVFEEDLLCVYLKNENEGFVTGSNGLLFKFWY